MAAASGVGSRIWDRDMEQFAAVLAEEVGEEKGDRVFLRQTAHSLSRGMQAADVAAVDVDLSEMIGDFSEAEGEEAGMHVSTGDAEPEPGFEDVDLSQMTGED